MAQVSSSAGRLRWPCVLDLKSWRVRAVLLPLLSLLLAGLQGGAPAHAGYAAIVLDAENGRVLHSRNADTRNFPASLTKMMTLYMVFEALDERRVTLDQRLTISRRAAGQAPSKLGLKAGETITVRQAIEALVVRSANDVATVVAEGLGGTEVKFAQMMTQRARRLGMRRTTFRNASGLPNRGQLSTARDMATLARALQSRFAHHFHYFSKRKFTYRGRTYRNHNKLLRTFDGTNGIKTGYTRASGYNLVASVERNGHSVVGVVFGGRSSRTRDRQMIKLLEAGLRVLGPSIAEARPMHKPVPPGAAQATRVAAVPTPEPAAPGGAQVASVAAPRPEGGDWGIQVGAFASFTPARLAAGNAADRLHEHIPRAAIEIQPTTSGGRTLYRARLIGMSETKARESCGRLRNRGEDCALVTPEGQIQLAALPR